MTNEPKQTPQPQTSVGGTQTFCVRCHSKIVISDDDKNIAHHALDRMEKGAHSPNGNGEEEESTFVVLVPPADDKDVITDAEHLSHGIEHGHGEEDVGAENRLKTNVKASPFDSLQRVERIMALASSSADSAEDGQHAVELQQSDPLPNKKEEQQPMCEACLFAITEEVERQIVTSESDLRSYEVAVNVLRKGLMSMGAGVGDDVQGMSTSERTISPETRDETDTTEAAEESDDNIDTMNEESLKAKLDSLCQEEATLLVEIAQLEEEAENVPPLAESDDDNEEDDLSKFDSLDSEASIDAAIAYCNSELTRLKETNLLNSIFHIWFSGPFGCINGFRLGRSAPSAISVGASNVAMNSTTSDSGLSSSFTNPFSTTATSSSQNNEIVPWDEVNAAWGQACLLLDVITKKFDIPISNFRLLPRGNFSVILQKVREPFVTNALW